MSRAKMRDLRRAIRNDQMRRVYDRAIEHGWTAERRGSDHLWLTSPDGAARMTMSTTAVAQGRGVLNNEAVLKRWLRQQNAPQEAQPMAHDDDDLRAAAGLAPERPKQDLPTVAPKPEPKPETKTEPDGLWQCPHCDARMKMQGSGTHLKMHRSREGRSATNGEATFTIGEIVEVAQFAGDGGLVMVDKLRDGLLLVARMRGGA
jgi:hypothetical protein